MVCLFYFQLFMPVASLAADYSPHYMTTLEQAKFNVEMAISDFNNVKDRTLDGLYEHFKNYGKLEIFKPEIKKLNKDDRAKIIPPISKVKTGYEWKVESDLTFTFSVNDLLAGEIYANNHLLKLPDTNDPILFQKVFQERLQGLNLNLKSVMNSKVLTFFISDAYAIAWFYCIAVGVIGFLGIFAVAVHANAQESEAYCAKMNDCNCMKKYNESTNKDLINIEAVMKKIANKKDIMKELSSINPEDKECAKKLEKVFSKSKDVLFDGISNTQFSKGICEVASFSKKCSEKRENGVAVKDTNKRLSLPKNEDQDTPLNDSAQNPALSK